MEILGPTGTGNSGNHPAFALGFSTSGIVQKVATIKDAKNLPAGTIVGDMHGGLTFNDAVASALEARSYGGWQEIRTPAGETWTIILLNR